jgi:hypothetical protein
LPFDGLPFDGFPFAGFAFAATVLVFAPGRAAVFFRANVFAISTAYSV